jgi:glycosyltransferase involved in cell wall biosynthesis
MSVGRGPIAFVVPGRIDTPTGGYIYDRHVVEGLRARGWQVDVRELDHSFPHPTGEARTQASDVLAGLPDGSVAIVDGLALGALPREVDREQARLRLIGFVHLPLADETGLAPGTANALLQSERAALRAVRHVVVPSTGTRDRLREQYGVDTARVTVIEPGTDAAPAARGSGGAIVHLLCVATLTPRKGHDTLFRALAAVPARTWFLTCAGSDDRDQATAEHLHALAREVGIEAQVRFIGTVDQETLSRHYDASDAFVLATYREGFCMGVAEALAHGLPIISTPACGLQDFITEGAGLLVPAGDVAALTRALTTVITDEEERRQLADGARRSRVRLPDWSATVERFENVLIDVQR